MRTLVLLIGAAFLWTAGIALADKKVTVCHFPPGNAANPQTISVGEAAVGAHLDHDDRLGECPTGCRLNESLCDDENACTSDSCNASGECQNELVNCDDGNPCTTDTCSVSEGCLYVANDGASCDDGVACTDHDACAGNECRGTPIAGCCTTTDQCNDGDACTHDACVGGRCTSDPRDCTVADKCRAGFCDPSSGCSTAPVNCDDTNVCTDDSCDPANGCSSQPTTNPPQPSESLCADGVDNDCDGGVDGADADCAGCAVDADCRLYPSFCGDGTACQCLVLGSSDPDPTCSGDVVQCFREPCFDLRAVCRNGTCDSCTAGTCPPPTCDCPGCTYVGHNEEECSIILFTCPDGSGFFSNACGCGCQTVPPCNGLCGANEYCCNDSCDICAPLGGTCILLPCN